MMPDTIIAATEDTYPITNKSRVKRAHQRGSHRHQDVYDIVDASYLCHVGYIIDNQPYVTPTIHWRVGNRIYWHGSSASRMLKTATNGMAATLTVTLFDGLVLARSPFHHSANYRSAMIYGTASAVTDLDEKRQALDHMMEYLYPGRLAESRENTDQEIKATLVAVMDIEEASAKVRTGPPIDDDEDIENIHCWTGVIPRKEVWGTPIPDPIMKEGIEMPQYLDRYLKNEME